VGRCRWGRYLPHPPRRRDLGTHALAAAMAPPAQTPPLGWDPMGEVHGHLHSHVSTPWSRSAQTRVIRDYPFRWIRLLSVIHFPIRINLHRKPHVNVGTIGHVDHGKTTFTISLITT
jgi:hypothetical protein